MSDSLNYVGVDTSAIWYQAFFRENTGFPTSKHEMEQFAIDFTKIMLYIKERFDPKDFAWFIDEKPWRSTYYDYWYRHRINYWQSKQDSKFWVICHNYKHYTLKYEPNSDTWIVSNRMLTVNQIESLGLKNPGRWYFFKGGKTPQDKLDNDPLFPKHVKESTYWKHLKHPKIYPEYKGNRKHQKWPYNTDRKSFKELAMKFTENLAPLLGARIIRTPRAEADDIAALYGHYVPSHHNCIFVARDADWHQIGGYQGVNFLYMYDPVSDELLQKDPRTAKFHLWLKILGGDIGDNIFPSKSVSNDAPYVEVKFEKGTDVVASGKRTHKWLLALLESNGWNFKEAAAKARKYQDGGTFDRNVMLVHLGKTPAKIRNAIWKTLHEETVRKPNPLYPSIYGCNLDKKDVITLKTKARNAQLLDAEEGLYSHG